LRIEFMLSHGHNKDATERKEIAYLRWLNIIYMDVIPSVHLGIMLL
jgi:hypothetical protein